MKKIVITGANGVIGHVLRKGLEYQITPLDLPENDVRDYAKLLKKFSGHEVAIHLAWNAQGDDFRTDVNPDNIFMINNVYRAALEAEVPRVIMASSVHADQFYNWEEQEPMSPNHVAIPNNPYGATKIFMEALGKYYATKGLEVICIRFGGVNQKNNPNKKELHYKKVWLSHDDCIRLIKICITAKKIPNNFLIIYGVSNNTGRIQDYSNPLGWIPKDNSEDY